MDRWESKMATMHPAKQPSNCQRADSVIGEDDSCILDERAEDLHRERKVFEKDKKTLRG